MNLPRQLTIHLDHLPPPELASNSLRRLHWTVRSRVTNEAKEEIGWLAKVQWKHDTPMVKARIHYQFIIGDKRKHDAENLLAACKAYVDGLIEVGVLIFDDIKYLEIGSVKAEYGDSSKTIITVEEVK